MSSAVERPLLRRVLPAAVAAALGAAALVSAPPWLALIAIAASMWTLWRAHATPALTIGAGIGAAFALAIVTRAGGAAVIALAEWGMLAGFVAAAAGAAALVAWLSVRGRVVGGVSGAVVLLALFAGASGLRYAIDPVLLDSRYLTMRDGVRIAVDSYVPRAAAAAQLPTILRQTRYFRAVELNPPFNLVASPASDRARAFARAGYAYVVADARGSGASFGNRQQEWSPDEVRDGGEIIDWIVRQPWSDGSVGAEGISYDGSTAEFAVANQHPALKVVAVAFALYDTYTDIARPGGILATTFDAGWAHFNDTLDRNALASIQKGLGRWMIRGVRPVAGQRARLAEAVADHEKNYDIYASVENAVYRDDLYGTAQSYASASPYSYLDRIRAAGTMIYGISGWYDGGYQAATLRRFLTVGGAGDRVTIGPWDHAGHQAISPCKEEDGAVPLDYNAELVDFFGYALKGERTRAASRRPVRYFLMCGDGWHEADSWPPADSGTRTVFLGPERSLVQPEAPAQAGSDRYVVDLSASQGSGTRWKSVFNIEQKPIGYPGLDRLNAKGLVYAGAPQAHDVDIVGSPLLTLTLASSAADGDVFVTLEDLAPDGTIRFVTDGQLRLIHRASAARPGSYASLGVQRSYARADAQPMPSEQAVEMVIELLPTAYRIRKGHRLTLALTGANIDEFAPTPGPAPVWTVHYGGAAASRLTLPVLAASADRP